jgi:potassium-transporting ATPase KdpC subunit
MLTNLRTALLYTICTTLIFGVGYPLAVTALAQLFWKDNAGGQIIARNGTLIGSRIIAQPFTRESYFHPRPSAAGNGYDASSSGGSNFGPTNQKLLDRVQADVASEQQQDASAVPIDMVTTSASGLDPDITVANALRQSARVAQARHLSPERVRNLVAQHTVRRSLGLFGEPRVNVLEINLALDQERP